MTALDAQTDAWTAERILAADRDYVIHPWTTQGATAPVVVAGGSGSWFWDTAGNRYLDFESQLVNLNLGHQHPRLVAAIKEQADRLCYIGTGFAERARAELAELMAEITPGDLRMSLFTTGGAAANENAMRLARHVTGRPKIMARYRSYHGATAGSLSATGDPRRWGDEPGVPGFVRFFDPYTYHYPGDGAEFVGLPHIEEILDYENPQSVAAVIIETVTGTNGVIYPPDGYLRGLRELCDRHGILLICDEVMVGFGRTGRWFACEHWDVVPDILTSAKGINSGYVPLGAMTVRAHIAEWLHRNPFRGGLTYAGHPLACASGVASIQIMRAEGIVENAERQGARLGLGLAELAERHPAIGDVRGRGLFYGLELVRDRQTRTPLVPFNGKGAAAEPMRAVLSAAMEAGLYLSAYNNILRLAPPLVITAEEIDLALEILDQVLIHADQEYDG